MLGDNGFGFAWGPLNVIRVAHNDGCDGKKIWYALDIRTPGGTHRFIFDRLGRIISQTEEKPITKPAA